MSNKSINQDTPMENTVAQHPFGHDITAANLISIFDVHNQWEDRYRQLILLAKKLPALPEILKHPNIELSGCENRLWLGHQQLENGSLHFYGDSEGRIVRGLLTVLLTAIEGKTPRQLLSENPLALFEQLGLQQQISTSRASGLQALAQNVRTIASRYIV